MTTRKERKARGIYDRFEALRRQINYTIEGTVSENLLENGIDVKVDLITSPALKEILQEFSSEGVIIDKNGLQIFSH